MYSQPIPTAHVIPNGAKRSEESLFAFTTQVQSLARFSFLTFATTKSGTPGGTT
jgi:hypothetical protein